MIFEAVLRGVNFRPLAAKEIVTRLETDDPLLLEREPTNPHDPNAIKVIHPASKEFLGYVGKEMAAEVAPYMDQGIEFDCFVSGWMGQMMPMLTIEEKGLEEEVEDEDA